MSLQDSKRESKPKRSYVRRAGGGNKSAQLPPKENQDPQLEPTSPEPEKPEGEDSVSVEIESQKSNNPLSGLLARAQTKLESDSAEVETPQKRKYIRRNESDEKEFAGFVSILVGLIVSFAQLPDPAKPEQGEIDSLSLYLTKILLRHFPVASKIGPDGMDVIGIIGVVAGWYARAKPYLDQPGGNDDGSGGSPRRDLPPPTKPGGEKLNGHGAGIQRAEVSAFLDRSAESFGNAN